MSGGGIIMFIFLFLIILFFISIPLLFIVLLVKLFKKSDRNSHEKDGF